MSAALAGETPLAGSWIGDEELAGLLTRAATGDLDAFSAFYDATATLVWRLELRRSRTRSLAELATCRRFEVAWTRAGEQRSSGLSPRAWLLSLDARAERGSA